MSSYEYFKHVFWAVRDLASDVCKFISIARSSTSALTANIMIFIYLLTYITESKC